VSNPKILPCDAGTISAARSEPACALRRVWVLAAAVLGSTLAFVDESVVNVALPRIESDLHTTLAAMQWVINAYTLCMSALLLIGGATADQFGRRRVFVIGVSVFALASLACGFAADVAVLVAARAAQGVGAALLVPCSLALIGAAYGEAERGAAIGVWSGASAIAAGVAPLLGGWLVDHASWRVIFFINPVLAVVTLAITLSEVPESRDPEAASGLDWRGAMLAFTGLGLLVYGLIGASQYGWGAARVVVSLVVGGVLLLGFVLSERAARAPMVPLALFRSPTFSGVNVLTLLLYGALGAAFFFLPFLLIQARGYSATLAGATYLPFTLILGVLSRWSGGLIDRFGARGPLIIGPTGVALGFLALAASGGAYAGVLGAMVVLGLAMSVTVTPLTTAVLNSVPAHRTGVASGINNAVASLGSLLLIAVLGSVALGVFDRLLEQHLLAAQATPGVRQALQAARGGFVMPPLPPGLSAPEQARAHEIVARSLIGTVRSALLIAAALAAASALTAALSIPRRPPTPPAS
jgi:EmrB/QacA subfamily drug resistance transporter